MRSVMATSRRVAVLFVAVCLLAVLPRGLQAENPYPQGAGIHGTILGYDMHDQLVPLSWAQITAEIDGVVVAQASSHDGRYEMFVPGGELTLTAEHPGYVTQTMSVYVSPGSSTPIDFTLERSNAPIPEYPTNATTAMAVLAIFALLLILRRRHINAR